MKIEYQMAVTALKLLMGEQGPALFSFVYETLNDVYRDGHSRGWQHGWDSGCEFAAGSFEPNAETIAAAERNLFGGE